MIENVIGNFDRERYVHVVPGNENIEYPSKEENCECSISGDKIYDLIMLCDTLYFYISTGSFPFLLSAKSKKGDISVFLSLGSENKNSNLNLGNNSFPIDGEIFNDLQYRMNHFYFNYAFRIDGGDKADLSKISYQKETLFDKALKAIIPLEKEVFFQAKLPVINDSFVDQFLANRKEIIIRYSNES